MVSSSAQTQPTTTLVGVGALKDLALKLGNETACAAVEHLATAISYSQTAIALNAKRGSAELILSSILMVGANLSQCGTSDFPGMLKHSVTAIRLEDLRAEFLPINSLLLRGKFAEAAKAVNKSLRQIPGIIESFRSESDWSTLTLPEVPTRAKKRP